MGGSHRQIRTRDGDLVVEVRGDGRPLLCLHGLTANRSTWHALAEHLDDDGLTLYMPDLLGRGESDVRSDLRYGLKDEVERARALVRELGLRDYLVVGHSQGAAIALALCLPEPGPGAARQREVDDDRPLPSGLVLVNPVTPWSVRPGVLDWIDLLPLAGAAASLLRVARRPVTRYILERRVFASRAAVSGEVVERYAAPYADPARARALVRVLADWRPAELAEYLAAPFPPVRVLAGSCDRRIQAGDIQRLTEQIDAHLDVFEDTGHALPEERPDAVAAALLDMHAATEIPPEERIPPEDSST